jgi:diacylglycerol kinase
MQRFSWKDRVKSFGPALNGVRLLMNEHNAWIHLVAAIIVVVLGIVHGLSRFEWLWVVLAIALVFITEMINTAIEAVCDELTVAKRPLIKKAKDMAAGAVLLAAIFAVVVGFLVFL